MKLIIHFVFAVLTQVLFSSASPENYKVELVQVLFRHGDRASDIEEIYKTDPYKQIFKEHGYGQLTKTGMQREYKIGQMLRKRYDSFLGEFRANEVYAYSTDTDRTKMSLQLVLAGLYPPSERTFWNANIHWSPIPANYMPSDIDFLRIQFFSECNGIRNRFIRAQNSPIIKQKMEKFKDFVDYVQNKTLIKDVIPFSLFLLYGNLHSALNMDLPLPDWCDQECYANLEEIAKINYEALTLTPDIKRTMSGLTIEKFLENLENDETGDSDKKIYLYSAHDTNIATFTRSHNLVWIPEIPDYGSTIIFEKLRGRDDKIYIRMLLWTGVSEQLITLKLKDCDSYCLLDKYKIIVEPLLPTDEDRKCISPKK